MGSSRFVGAGLLQTAATALSVLVVLAPRASLASPAGGASQGSTPPPVAFVVRGYESVASRPPALRKATVVRVARTARAPCAVDVEFRGGGSRCLLHAVLNPGENHAFCSRAVNHPLVGCRSSCAPEAKLAAAGQVYVSAACEEIDVAAQVVFTRGSEDREWDGVSDLRVDALPRPPPQRGGP